MRLHAVCAGQRRVPSSSHATPNHAAIVEFVTAVLPQNPARMTKPLGADLEGLRSARRGDYRVLVRPDDQARVVILHRVAHRAHVYRPD